MMKRYAVIVSVLAIASVSLAGTTNEIMEVFGVDGRVVDRAGSALRFTSSENTADIDAVPMKIFRHLLGASPYDLATGIRIVGAVEYAQGGLVTGADGLPKTRALVAALNDGDEAAIVAAYRQFGHISDRAWGFLQADVEDLKEKLLFKASKPYDRDLWTAKIIMLVGRNAFNVWAAKVNGES